MDELESQLEVAGDQLAALRAVRPRDGGEAKAAEAELRKLLRHVAEYAGGRDLEGEVVPIDPVNRSHP